MRSLFALWARRHRIAGALRDYYWTRRFGSCGPHLHVYGPLTAHRVGNIHVGSHVSINCPCVLTARSRITIGDWVHISTGVIINTGSLQYEAPREDRGHTEAPVAIGAGAWICSGAIINPGVTIGEDAVVAAGAVVTHDVPANTIVAGVPARVIGRNVTEQAARRRA